MKRTTSKLRRILFNALTAISLLLALATAGLWVRNLFAADFLILCTDRTGQVLHYLELGSASGRITLAAFSHSRNTKTPNATQLLPDHFGPTHLIVESGPAHSPMRVRLFGAHPEDALIVLQTGYYRVPHWLLFALASLTPATRLAASAIRLKRRGPGHCPACGYDTRANPSRCSECGRETAAVSD